MISNDDANLQEATQTNRIIPERLTINNWCIKDQLTKIIMSQNVEPGSHIKVNSNILNFKPIYQYCLEEGVGDLPSSSRKSRKKSEMRKMEPVFKYGSQLYLKTGLTFSHRVISMHKPKIQIISVQLIRNISLPLNQCMFFQILIKGEYLTKKQDRDVFLSKQSSNESIWTIEQAAPNNYYLFNISNNCYLGLKKADERQSKILFASSPTADSNSMFNIYKQNNSNYYILTPCSLKKSPSSSSMNRGQNRFGTVNLGLQLPIQQSLMIKIQILPVEGSMTSLFYQLKFVEHMLRNYPSLSLIHQIIDQLIYYRIPEFGQSQGLLSIPIQKLLSQFTSVISSDSMGTESISYCILKFLTFQINQYGYSNQLAKTIEKDIRLLCLGSQQNSQIFAKLISKILQMSQYQLYIPSLVKLISNNRYFINFFQSYGWARIIFRKLQTTYSLQQFDIFYNLMKLAAQFCIGNYSIANKYLMMHSLQQIREPTQKKVDPEQETYNLWTRFFNEGQYVFVQVESQNKLDQIQLQTFLNTDEKNRLKYVGQINMISAFCSGFNVNAINRYYQVLKALSPYCYNQTFPFFSHPECKQSTLGAIAMSFDWNDQTKKLCNKYNIGFVFFENQSKQQNVQINRTSFVRQKAITRPKFGFYKQTQTLTDVLRNLNNAFQNHVRDFLTKIQKGKSSIADLIIFKDENSFKFGSKILNWIKIVQISLGARLITILKKKSSAYAQYFKKIFQKTKKEKSLTPSKRLGYKKQTSAPQRHNVIDNEYQGQVNVILDFISRLIKYSPIYQMYLKQMRIRKQGKANKERFMDRVFNNTKSNYFYKQFESQKLRNNQSYNKVMHMDDMVLNQSQKEEIKYTNQIKLICFQILSLVYQNIIQEQVQLQVQNLGILAKQSNKLTNSISSSSISFEEGFKKFPCADENFKMSLIQNWYLQSNPKNLDQITTCLRYIYDQPQIYMRAVNQTILLFNKQTMSFYQGIQVPISQLHKLSMCIATWCDPRILNSHHAYYDNYSMLIRSLQGINNQIRKLSLTNILVLQDYQQILQNIGIIDISLNIIVHLNKFTKTKLKPIKHAGRKNQQVKSLKRQSQDIMNQLVKILEFYVHFNDDNKKKIMIILGESLTQSVLNFPFLIFMLRQSQKLQSLIQLTNTKIMTNILKNLPYSKQYLQIILTLNDFQFVVQINKLTKQLHHFSLQQNEHQWQKQILLNCQCFQLLCKIAFKLITISQCQIQYLKWFYDTLLRLYIERQVALSIHFKTKIIQTLRSQDIQLSSSIAYLIYALFLQNSLKVSLGKQKRKIQLFQLRINTNGKFKYGNKLKDREGWKNVSNYILAQCLASNLESDTNLVRQYIDYYINDLLPLINVCDDSLLNEDIKKAIFQKAQEYLIFQQQGQDTIKSISNTTDLNVPISSKNIQRTISLNHDFQLEDNSKILKHKSNILKVEQSLDINKKNREKKLKLVENILFRKQLTRDICPRAKSLYPPSRPQQVGQKNSKISQKFIEKEDKKEDQFEKVSKKAKKMWFKGKSKMNEYRQMYISRSKFLEDIQQLETQYENYQNQKQFIISARDVLSKLISILMNGLYLSLNPQNQIFLNKICLVWFNQILQQKNKKNDKKRKKKSQLDNGLQKWYLIKKFEINTIIIGILDQLQAKISSSTLYKNLICICYQIKCCNLLIQLNDQNISEKTISQISLRIFRILPKLTDHFWLHKQLLNLYQMSKSLDTWELVNSWEPIKLICQLSSFLILNFQQNFSKVKHFDDFCSQFLMTRARLSKTKTESEIAVEQVLNLLKQINPMYLRDQQNILMANSDLYQCLLILG